MFIFIHMYIYIYIYIHINIYIYIYHAPTVRTKSMVLSRSAERWRMSLGRYSYICIYVYSYLCIRVVFQGYCLKDTV